MLEIVSFCYRPARFIDYLCTSRHWNQSRRCLLLALTDKLCTCLPAYLRVTIQRFKSDGQVLSIIPHEDLWWLCKCFAVAGGGYALAGGRAMNRCCWLFVCLRKRRAEYVANGQRTTLQGDWPHHNPVALLNAMPGGSLKMNWKALLN